MSTISSKSGSDSAQHDPKPQDPTLKSEAPVPHSEKEESNSSTSPDKDQPDLSPEEARKHAEVGKQMAAAFGELVTLLMRSETDRKRPISDLEWMIAPAIVTGQFAIADAQSKKTGAIAPVGAVLWAMVSEDIDQKLSNADDEAVQLNPKDWRSGNIPWIVLAMGDKRVIAGLIKKLAKDVFRNQEPKIRSRDKDGNIVVGRVRLSQAPTEPSETKNQS